MRIFPSVMVKKNPQKSEYKSTIIYIIVGIALALGINQGLAIALSTSVPIVAVESNSMVPTFYKGDILLIHGLPPKELKKGDIIVFTVAESSVPIVHRIVDINDDGTFQTKGDANNAQLRFETRIEAKQILGKEIAIIPIVGWIKIGITEYVGPNILIVVVVIIVAAFSYPYIKRFAAKKLTPINKAKKK